MKVLLSSRGQTIIEYLLLLSLVALIALWVVEFVQGAFKEGGQQLKETVIERNLHTGVGF